MWRRLPPGTPPAVVDAILTLADAYAAGSAAAAVAADGRRGELARAVQSANLRPCGTRAAAARHRRHGEPVDEACRRAESKDSLKRQRQAASGGRVAYLGDASRAGRAA